MQIIAVSNRPKSTRRVDICMRESLNRDDRKVDSIGLVQDDNFFNNEPVCYNIGGFMHTAFDDFCISDRLQSYKVYYHTPLKLAVNESIMEAERCKVVRFRKVTLNDNYTGRYVVARGSVLPFPIKFIKTDTYSNGFKSFAGYYNWVYNKSECQVHQSDRGNRTSVAGIINSWVDIPISYTYGNPTRLF